MASYCSVDRTCSWSSEGGFLLLYVLGNPLSLGIEAVLVL